jgi:hypothetical protein
MTMMRRSKMMDCINLRITTIMMIRTSTMMVMIRIMKMMTSIRMSLRNVRMTTKRR